MRLRSSVQSIALLTTAGLLWGCTVTSPSLVRAVPADDAAAVANLSTAATGVSPVPVEILDGSSETIGQTHGRDLAESIGYLHETYLSQFIKPGLQRMVAMGVATIFEADLRPEHRDELVALAAGAKQGEKEMMLEQCFLDVTAMSACSTIALPADAAPDHVARFGRNLEFFSLNIADKYSTLFVVRPTDGRYAFVSVGWPGLMGVLSGMNEHGLCLANMEVPRGAQVPHAMPYTLLYRTVLERCKTVDEAVALLKKTPIQTANNLMLMDAAGDRAAVELSPDFVHVRRADGHTAVISTNHQRDQNADKPGLCDRYDYLHDTSKAEFGRIDESAIQKMLRHVGDDTTLQSMVFEPANRVIYLATGQDASTKEFHRIDLKPYFHGGR
jgi:isopenicillin-N N-acyltransferase-like protein